MPDRKPQTENDVRTGFAEGLKRIWTQYSKVRDLSVVTMLVASVFLIGLDITLGFLIKAVSHQQSGTPISLIQLMFVFVFLPGTLVIIILFARQWVLLSREDGVINAEINTNDQHLKAIAIQAALERERVAREATQETDDGPEANGYRPRKD